MNWVSEALDRKNHVDAVYFDFSKAFDVIPHGRLLEKFRGLGLTGLPLKWYEAWLGLRNATGDDGISHENQRRQYVHVGKEASVNTTVTSGVIQGSRLGPYSFRIYLNDLLSELNNCNGYIKALCYADDLTLLGHSSTEEDIKNLKHAINIAAKWSLDNGLRYNAQKIFVIHHSASIREKNKRHSYDLSGHQIESTTTQKDLGLIFFIYIRVIPQSRMQRKVFIP